MSVLKVFYALRRFHSLFKFQR